MCQRFQLLLHLGSNKASCETEVEDCLNDVTTKFIKHDLESLDRRLKVLKTETNQIQNAKPPFPPKSYAETFLKIKLGLMTTSSMQGDKIYVPMDYLSERVTVAKKLLTYAEPGLRSQILDCKTLTLLTVFRLAPHNLILLLALTVMDGFKELIQFWYGFSTVYTGTA